MISYIDDILIYSLSVEEHILHMKLILLCLLENQLDVKGEKCKFHVSTISFLGYIISP